MSKLLSSAFSPLMIPENSNLKAEVIEFNIEDIPEDVYSVVGHENTAKILTALLGKEVKYNRQNVELKMFDVLYVIIPKFRTTESREFTKQEVEDAGFRCFKVSVN